MFAMDILKANAAAQPSGAAGPVQADPCCTLRCGRHQRSAPAGKRASFLTLARYAGLFVREKYRRITTDNVARIACCGNVVNTPILEFLGIDTRAAMVYTRKTPAQRNCRHGSTHCLSTSCLRGKFLCMPDANSAA
jgi:hypothetical protein